MTQQTISIPIFHVGIYSLYGCKWLVGAEEQHQAEAGEDKGLPHPLVCGEELYTGRSTIARYVEGNPSWQPPSISTVVSQVFHGSNDHRHLCHHSHYKVTIIYQLSMCVLGVLINTGLCCVLTKHLCVYCVLLPLSSTSWSYQHYSTLLYTTVL